MKTWITVVFLSLGCSCAGSQRPLPEIPDAAWDCAESAIEEVIAAGQGADIRAIIEKCAKVVR